MQAPLGGRIISVRASTSILGHFDLAAHSIHMLDISLSDAEWFDESTLLRRLTEADGIRLKMEIGDLYQASPVEVIADNWLKAWYIAERIGECATTVTCAFEEGEDGAGEFVFTFLGTDSGTLAATILELGPVFDPDNLEAGALIYDEAADWLQRKGTAHSRFPDIEQCYRDDSEQAVE